MNKLKSNTDGFSAIELLLIIVALAVIFVGGYFVAKHVDKKSTPSNTSTWEKYSNQSAGFAVNFISKPSVFNLPNGTTTYQSQDSSGTNYYDVDVVNGSAGTSLSQVVSTAIKGQQLVLNNFNIISQTSITVSGNPAIDLICMGTAKANGASDYINNEFIQVGSTIYEPLTHSSSGGEAPNTQFFLNSFKIL